MEPERLNPYQDRAVSLPGHVTILACPGSGKTRVLSARAAKLLTGHEKGRLCAVTFTRDAATELRNRILSACGMDKTRRLAVGTFHSLALYQIKRFSRSKPPRLLSEGERLAVLRRCWQHYAPNLSFDEVSEAIEAAKARITAPPFANPQVEAVFHGYQEIMASEGAMDFADLMLFAVRRMKTREIPHLPIRWLLVDEAQDMDEVQMEWVLMHGHAGVEITIVGDDDQSLYAFRHALGYDGLKNVTIALSATETTLPINYRCAPNILDHAARLIAHNQNRAPKKILAHREYPGEIQVHRVPDRWAEVDFIVEAVGNAPNGEEWAILARTNQILDVVEVGITGLGRPYSRSGGNSVWEHSLGSLFTGMLRSVVDDSWTGVANALMFCGIPADWINGHSTRSYGGCLDRLESAIGYATDDGLRRIIRWLQKGFTSWREQAAKGRAALVIHGVAAFLVEYCKPNQGILLRKLEETLVKLPGTLPQRLAIIGMRNPDREKKPSIQIMTLHASKGLEFDNVWIMGCEEGNLPHTDSTEEEERRLLYVGMTRARHRLILSSSMEEGFESRFIEEAGL